MPIIPQHKITTNSIPIIQNLTANPTAQPTPTIPHPTPTILHQTITIPHPTLTIPHPNHPPTLTHCPHPQIPKTLTLAHPPHNPKPHDHNPQPLTNSQPPPTNQHLTNKLTKHPKMYNIPTNIITYETM